MLSTNGTKYKGKMFRYNGTTWIPRDKIKQRQSCLSFDLFDENGNSFTTYTNTPLLVQNFFSYKIGTGAVDPELGFALSTQMYKTQVILFLTLIYLMTVLHITLRCNTNSKNRY